MRGRVTQGSLSGFGADPGSRSVPLERRSRRERLGHLVPRRAPVVDRPLQPVWRRGLGRGGSEGPLLASPWYKALLALPFRTSRNPDGTSADPVRGERRPGLHSPGEGREANAADRQSRDRPGVAGASAGACLGRMDRPDQLRTGPPAKTEAASRRRAGPWCPLAPRSPADRSHRRRLGRRHRAPGAPASLPGVAASATALQGLPARLPGERERMERRGDRVAEILAGDHTGNRPDAVPVARHQSEDCR